MAATVAAHTLLQQQEINRQMRQTKQQLKLKLELHLGHPVPVWVCVCECVWHINNAKAEFIKCPKAEDVKLG